MEAGEEEDCATGSAGVDDAEGEKESEPPSPPPAAEPPALQTASRPTRASIWELAGPSVATRGRDHRASNAPPSIARLLKQSSMPTLLPSAVKEGDGEEEEQQESGRRAGARVGAWAENTIDEIISGGVEGTRSLLGPSGVGGGHGQPLFAAVEGGSRAKTAGAAATAGSFKRQGTRRGSVIAQGREATREDVCRKQQQQAAAAAAAAAVTAGSKQRGVTQRERAQAHWQLVRRLLWRVVNPSAAFTHIVRRAAFAHKTARTLRAMECFSSMTEAELVRLASSGCELSLQRYKVLYREGATACNLYILLDGSLEHASLHSKLSEGLRLQTADGTTDIGVPVGTETLTNVRRMTTVAALTPCRLLQFSSADLGAAHQSVYRQFVATTLRAIPLFKGLRPEVFDEMATMFDAQEFDGPGFFLLHEGAVPSAFYILVHGTATVERGSDAAGDRKVIAQLHAQNADEHNSYPFFGELGLINKQPAVASVYTSSAAKVLVVHKANFYKFLRLLKDFETRVKRIGELRRRQTDLIVNSPARRRSSVTMGIAAAKVATGSPA